MELLFLPAAVPCHEVTTVHASQPSDPASLSLAGLLEDVGDLRSQAVDRLVSGDFSDRWNGLKRLTDLGESVIPPLLNQLQDPDLDWEGQWFVIRALGNFDRPDVVDCLAAALESTDDVDLQGALAEALGRIGPSAVPALATLVANPHRQLAAVQALARIHHPTAMTLLMEVGQQGDAILRGAALEALAQFNDASLVQIVVAALEDPAAPVREVAVQGLVNFRSHLAAEAYVALLQRRLSDPDLAVTQRAIHALSRSPLGIATAALEALAHQTLGPEAAPGEESTQRQAVIQALGFQETKAALAALDRLWWRCGEADRRAIVSALSRQQSQPLQQSASALLTAWLYAVPPLSPNLRQTVAFSLGQVGNRQTVAVLHQLLSDGDEGVRLHAAAALQQLRHRHNGEPTGDATE